MAAIKPSKPGSSKTPKIANTEKEPAETTDERRQTRGVQNNSNESRQTRGIQNNSNESRQTRGIQGNHNISLSRT